VRGESGLVPSLMRRLYGSDDLFPDDRMNAYRPSQSVNYITSHDGPTLRDLVSFDHKHNWANGHENRDGPRDSFSWNCGWEGNEHVPEEVERLRLRQAKNYFALLLLANGTPMLRAGDEFFHSQNGNDNPYNQDDESTWLDWSGCERHAELRRFVQRMIAFRKAHSTLSRARFWRDDVQWFGARDQPDLSPASTTIAYCLRGASQRDVDLYVMINGGQETVAFTVQEGTTGGWRRVIDTGLAGPLDFCEPGAEWPLSSIEYAVAPRSIVVLMC
jgi:isoamylase